MVILITHSHIDIRQWPQTEEDEWEEYSDYEFDPHATAEGDGGPGGCCVAGKDRTGPCTGANCVVM